MNAYERIKSYEPIVKKYSIVSLVKEMEHYCIFTVEDQSGQRYRMKVFLAMSEKDKKIMEKNLKKYIFHGHKMRKGQNIIKYYDYSIRKMRNSAGSESLYDIIIICDMGKVFNANYAKLSRQEVIKLGIDMCHSIEVYNKKNMTKMFISEHNVYCTPTGTYCIGGLENDMLHVKNESYDSDMAIIGKIMQKAWDQGESFVLEDIIISIAERKKILNPKLKEIIAIACAGDKYTYKKASHMRKDLEQIYHPDEGHTTAVHQEPIPVRESPVSAPKIITQEKSESRTMVVASFVHIGASREINEDNVYVDGKYINSEFKNSDKFVYKDRLYGTKVFAVCDGMGGAAGKKVALSVVDRLSRYHTLLSNAEYNVWDKIVYKYICDINKRIALYNQNNSRDVGSTLALVVMNDKFMHVYNIGDSRVYLMQDTMITQISEDHTLAMQNLKRGLLSKEQALKSKDMHVLTKALGMSEQDASVVPAITKLRIEDGMKVILCTDGLTKGNTNTEIQTMMNQNIIPVASEKCIRNALNRSVNDNMALIAIDIQK